LILTTYLNKLTMERALLSIVLSNIIKDLT